MNPYFSIIIPYHNSKDTIGPLLDSIAVSEKAPLLEVIVVDDGSEKPANNVIPAPHQRAGSTPAGILKIPHHVRDDKMMKWKTLDVRIHTLFYNKGPGAARNRGAGIAKGKFLVFFDSDVVLFPDALHNLWQIYEDDPDIVAVTGVWVKHQKTKKFFPNFKALRDWSYWINERDKSGYYYLFSTRCASIKREVFERLKGFDETYTSPLVEDIEFTYRVARRYAIIFAPNVRVHHEFEDFLPIAKKYFWRSYFWTKLYQSRKKFDPVATTLQEAVTALSGVGIVLMSLIVPIFGVMSYELRVKTDYVHLFYILTLTSYLLTLVVHLFFTRKFLAFVYQEKGIWFAIKSFFTGLVLYCFIAAGAVWGRIH